MFVPLGQALVSGVILGLAIGAIGWLAWDWDLLIGWAVATICGVGVSWLIALNASRGTLWRIERATGLDLDQDGAVGQPEPEAHPLVVNGYQSRHAQAQDARDEAEERLRRELSDFVRACGSGDTSMRRFEKHMSREQYQRFRDVLIKSGWARWKNPRDMRQGWELTAPASEVLGGVFR